MCGIVGFTWEDTGAVQRMADCVKHRGPDDAGVWSAAGISFGHRRLSVIDLSPAAHQPMTTSDGRYTIIYNGEVYNFRSLRAELEQRGLTFRSQTDSEVMLQAFAAWGPACFAKCNGMFACAIWDRDTQTLVLARDPMGIKPLYWTRTPRGVIFASEAKALLTHPEVSRQINVEALNLYLRLQYVPSPHTMWQDIRKLPPGTTLTVNNGTVTEARYWQAGPLELFGSPGEAREALRLAARDAIRDQLVADVPLGVFLSGGVDSSAILGLMRSITSGPIKTFSIGFEANTEGDKYNADFALAEQTARHFGTDHYPIVMTGADVAAMFERMIWHMDEPLGNPIQAATLLLSQRARKEITVALGGDGGDELFGGYERYWLIAQLARFERLPRRLQTLTRKALEATGRWDAVQAKLAVPAGAARHLAFLSQKEEAVSALLQPAANRPAACLAHFAPFFAAPSNDPANDMMRTDLMTWLPDESLLRSDKMTMAYGLEQRVPLLDLRLVDVAQRIPSAWKLDSRSRGKQILRQALGDMLPPHIRGQKKRGFFSPAAKWLRGDLLPLAREMLRPDYAPATADLLNFPAITALLDDHVAARRYGLPFLCSVMCLQAWAKRFNVSR